MATYFHGVPEIQPVDGLQTLYLMNPSYVAYTADSSSPPTTSHHHHHPNNMLFLNSPLTSLAPQQQQQQQQQNPQHYVGIPLQTLQDSSYSLWAPNMSSIDFHSQLGMKRGPSSSSDAPGSSQQQGLSLSLSPEVQAAVAAAAEAGEGGRGGEEVKMVGVMGSKYLKAAQELLDEVVSVGKGSIHGGREKGKETRDKIAGKEEEDGGGDGGGGTGSGGGDMSTAERQELQMKKAKLVHMLDEVEQRYRQYHHQMQLVVSSFEAVAGFGSAKSYTALALQTISKQFRCLRDAIAAQVRATGKSLGEEDCLAGSKSSMGSRLRFIDHHLRQQRALQQLGMIQHNAWRPQRGLPERAVSVLRAWLFEHFLHPYPKDSDKHMLAKQTGLTRSQVSNWFINARVRLWKPMVEEMYLEETKGQEQSNNNDDDDNNNNTTKTSKSEATNHSHSPSKSPTTTTSSPSVADHHPKPISIGPKQSSPLPPPLPSSEYSATMMFTVGDPLIRQRMKKTRTSEDNDNNNLSSNNNMVHDELSNRELLMKFMDHSSGFGGYPMSEIVHFDHQQQQQQQQQFSAPRFGGNGAVSLTLGLPHCEYLTNEGIQMSSGENNNNNYFNLNNTNSNNMSHHHPSGSHSTPNVYESISIQNRKRFPAQLLPDYVA